MPPVLRSRAIKTPEQQPHEEKDLDDTDNTAISVPDFSTSQFDDSEDFPTQKSAMAAAVSRPQRGYCHKVGAFVRLCFMALMNLDMWRK
jgi:hypothetical protein